MAPWVAALLTALICLGLGALAWSALSAWEPTGSAAISSPNTVGRSSGKQFGPNAEVALIALATRYAETPAVSPEPGPLAVWLADAPQPTREPTHIPATATIVAQVTAIAQAAKTATAAARPRDCNDSPPGRLCIWATVTPTIPPPLPTVPPCQTPIPGELCRKERVS